MSNTIEIKVEEGVKTLEILTGEAQKRREPVKVAINGLIDAPLRYLEKRASEINLKSSYVEFNSDMMNIKLVVDEKSTYSDTITGKLLLNPEFVAFGINTGASRTTFELSDFIKMNRPYFDSKQDAMKLVSELRHFKAKVNKDLEHADDNRGNKRLKMIQIVESNIPAAFEVCIPIFKGRDVEIFEVEVNINADDFSCVLISPAVKDFIIEQREDILGEQMVLIQELVPELLIIEV